MRSFQTILTLLENNQDEFSSTEDEVKQRNKHGNLLHCYLNRDLSKVNASPDVVQKILDAFPGAKSEMTAEKLYPLHVALRYSAPPSVVEKLITKEAFHKISAENALFGWLAVIFPVVISVLCFGLKTMWLLGFTKLIHSVAFSVVVVLFSYAILRILSSYKVDGNPLHFVLVARYTESEVLEIVQHMIDKCYDECKAASKDKNKVGSIPLKLALENGASNKVIKKIIDLFDEITEVFDYPEFTIDQLAKIVSLKLTEKETRAHSWTSVLHKEYSIGTDKLSEIVDKVFEYKIVEGSSEISKELAYCRDRKGKTGQGKRAYDIVSPEIQEIMRRHILFLGKYEFGNENLKHKSATSVVYIANEYISSSGEEGADKQPMKRALKFLRERDQWNREKQALTELCDQQARNELPIDVDSKVIGIFDSKDDLIESDLEKHGLAEYKYLLVLEACDQSLFDIIAHGDICKRLDMIKGVTKEICQCLDLLHGKKRIHGDIKPLNIMRKHDGHYVLIDFDASVGIGEICGMKLSTAYMPPEMTVYIDGELMIRNPESNPLSASIAYDMWALGVLLFNLCTGHTLWQTTVDDNLANKDDLKALYDWSHEIKQEKLRKVEYHLARSLISQLLSKTPEYRLDVAHVLMHPFITGHFTQSRLPGQYADYHFFISYRQAADAKIAHCLYDVLTAAGFNVFLDDKCLPFGKDWQEEFLKGLSQSEIFIPLLSREAINCASDSRQNFSAHKEDSDCDNVLLEYRMALELYRRGMISMICPILIGDIVNGVYEKYTFKGPTACHPQFTSSVVVRSIEMTTILSLEKMGLGSTLLDSTPVPDILFEVCKFQGRFLEGDLTASLEAIANDISALDLVAKNTSISNKSTVDELIKELARANDKSDREKEELVKAKEQSDREKEELVKAKEQSDREKEELVKAKEQSDRETEELARRYDALLARYEQLEIKSTEDSSKLVAGGDPVSFS